MRASQTGSSASRSRTTPSLVTTSSEQRNRAARGTNRTIERATPIRIENSTLIKRAEKAVIKIKPASYPEARSAKRNRRQSTSLAAVTDSRPAKAAFGTYRAKDASESSTTATVAAANTHETRVTAPDWKLIAERVSEPDPGKHWKKPPVRFAKPSARHWRL